MALSIDHNMADVSVIMPAYNAASTISRALKSVAAQTVKPREVVVVDDGSSDGTAEQARACGALMPDVSLVVISQENCGPGAARNKALSTASSTFVAFLDADDEWYPEKIERSINALTKEKLTLVAHNFIREDEQGSSVIVDCARYYERAAKELHSFYLKGFIGTLTVVADRQTLIDVGGFNEKLPAAQDFDLWLKVVRRSSTRWSILSDCLGIYHPGITGITRNTKQRLKSGIQVAKFHAPLLGRGYFESLRLLWLRLIAIHYEAFHSYWNSHTFGGAALAVFGLADELVSAPFYLWVRKNTAEE